MKKLLLVLALVSLDANAYQYYHSPSKTSDTVVQVLPNGNALDSSNPTAIQTGDSASIDAAGRFRTSHPYGLFEDKRVSGIGDTTWEDSASGVGAGSSWNSNEATVSLTVGTGAGDYEFRQSHYIQYVPGKSQFIKLTFVMGTPVTNVAKRAGYFDDNDGFYFQQEGTTNSLCLRTSTSGTPVDTCIPQSSWNLDKMDGSCTLTPVSRCQGTSNPSGINFDSTKTQLLEIDFLWQGVGRIRFGFNINGRTYYVHQILNSNTISVPYIATPNLPVRYEIRNLAASAGGSMKQICSSVESEGGYQLPGSEFAISNGITLRAVTTRAPILAIRLANTYNGKANRKIARILHSSYLATTNDAYCELVHVHFPASVTGGTWTAISAQSGIEYNTGLTAVTGTTQHTIDGNFVSTGLGSASSTVESTLEWVNKHGVISQNITSTNSEMFVVYCTAFAGTSNVSAELDWIESN